MATATAQKVKEKQDTASTTGTWNSVFPNEQVTETQSLLYVKKLLAVTVSSISYLRAIFPEHAFGDRALEGLSLKILRDDSSCSAASQVIKWMKGCFDALEKKYLKTLILGIYTDVNDPDTVIESYTFKFSYENNGGMDLYRNQEKVSSAHSADQTKKATVQLLRTLILLSQTLGTLPDEVMMTMKIFYYDDVTPTEYEPPGFRAADAKVFKFDDDVTNIRIGEVSTNFHSIKLRVKTGSNEMTRAGGVAPHSAAMAGGNGDAKRDLLLGTMVPDVKMATPPQNEKGRASRRQANPGPSGDAPPTVSSDSDNVVRCPCACNEDDGMMIMCEICHVWQHAVCFKILEENNAPMKHFCEICSIKVRTPCTDPMLEGLDLETIKFICLWRRTLLACTESFNVNVTNIGKRLGCPVSTAHFLVNRLEQEGVLTNVTKSKRRGRHVQPDVLDQCFSKFIRGNELFNQYNTDANVCAEATPHAYTQSDVNTQIADLTVMADTMTVSATHPSIEGAAQRSKFDGKLKGIVCVKRGTHEFELSSSQTSDDVDSRRKRHKASRVREDVRT